MLGKDIGTVMRHKIGHWDFLFRVVGFSPMLWALFCSDLNMIGIISSKRNVLSHRIAHIVQQPPRFDICRTV